MTRPRLHTEGTVVPGLIAVALFAVFAAVFLGAAFPSPAGFGGNAAVMKSLGASLMSIDPSLVAGNGNPVPAEGFVVSLVIVAVALDAALDGSLILARREESGENVTVGEASAGEVEDDAVVTDGGAE